MPPAAMGVCARTEPSFDWLVIALLGLMEKIELRFPGLEWSCCSDDDEMETFLDLPEAPSRDPGRLEDLDRRPSEVPLTSGSTGLEGFLFA